MTKEELLFLADKVDVYRNCNEEDWALSSCPISPDDRHEVTVVADLPTKTLAEYG